MRLYRALLNLYPARFREEYSGPLAQQFADEYRDAGGWGRAMLWMRALADLAVSIPFELARELAQDLRFSVRVYRRRAFVTTLALAALALAIGGTTGVFSVLNALLLRGLPFREPERLVVVGAFVNVLRGGTSLEEWTRRSPYLSSAVSFETFPMNLDRGGEGLRTNAATTGPGFFEVLGVTPRLGRTLAGEPEGSPVAVIGFALWQQAFGADPRVLGRTIRLNGVPLTVVGIAPPGMDYPAQTGVWTTAQRFPRMGVSDGGTIARLRDGVTLAAARALFRTEVERSYAPGNFREQWAPRASLDPIRDDLAGPVRGASFALLGAVGFVLLIACANIAQLFLSRIGERRPELAIRAALGASRARIVQQLTTEAILLTLAAAGAGLVVAQWTAQLSASVQPAQLAGQNFTILDWRVLTFAAALAILTGLVFGVVPAIVTLRRQVRSAGPNRLRVMLVAAQAALTVVLLAGSVTLGRGFLRLLGTDLGFSTTDVVTLNVSLLGSDYQDDQARFHRQAIERLRATPGVESAGAVNYLPLIPNLYLNAPIQALDGAPARLPIPMASIATADYFRALRTQVLAGREFDSTDSAQSERVVVVNEEFARESGFGPGIVGHTVKTNYGGEAVSRIAGVVRSVRLNGPTAKPRPQIYFLADQRPPGFLTFVARVRGDAASYLPLLRDAVQSVDRSIPVYDVQTLEQRLAANLARPRFYTAAVGSLAVFALLLAIIGVYGTVTHAIEQRTKEIGVRIAVGAPAGVVRAMLARECLLPVLLGLLVGTGIAVWLGGLPQILVPADPVGPAVCTGAAALLLLVAAAAVWRATARVLRINPLQTLRTG